MKKAGLRDEKRIWALNDASSAGISTDNHLLEKTKELAEVLFTIMFIPQGLYIT